MTPELNKLGKEIKTINDQLSSLSEVLNSKRTEYGTLLVNYIIDSGVLIGMETKNFPFIDNSDEVKFIFHIKDHLLFLAVFTYVLCLETLDGNHFYTEFNNGSLHFRDNEIIFSFYEKKSAVDFLRKTGIVINVSNLKNSIKHKENQLAMDKKLLYEVNDIQWFKKGAK